MVLKVFSLTEKPVNRTELKIHSFQKPNRNRKCGPRNEQKTDKPYYFSNTQELYELHTYNHTYIQNC